MAQGSGDDEILKPLGDGRSYRLITLANRMTCLLVSDPKITAPRLARRGMFSSCCAATHQDVEEGGEGDVDV